MRTIKIDEKIVNIVEKLYAEIECAVIINGHLTPGSKSTCRRKARVSSVTDTFQHIPRICDVRTEKSRKV